MTIVSTREFRSNQTRYLDMVDNGENVILRSRRGSYRLTPVPTKKKKPIRDITPQVCQAMKEWKQYLDTGESDYFRPASELLNELRNPNG